MNHTLYIEADCPLPEGLEQRLTQTIHTALSVQEVELPCEINVLLTDDPGIQAINQEMRGLDKPTDVLSFPMFSLTPGSPPKKEDKELLDPASKLLPLGDMVLSLQRAEAQGEEYGHGFFREVTYLTVHSVLHLLGYDHLDEGEEKALMRSREKEIMKQCTLEEK